jgi:hypothetical protein
LRRSPRALGRSWASGCSLATAPALLGSRTRILSWACGLLQSPPSSERPPASRHPKAHGSRGSSREVSYPFSVSPLEAAALELVGLASPGRQHLQVFSTSWRLNRPEPAGLVSCRIRSWGCTLQSFAPPLQPHAVSGAVALLSFRRTRRPAPLHRRAIRRPPAVRVCPIAEAPGVSPGSAAAFRALLHIGVHHFATGGLGRRRARSSPGLLALQGVPPRRSGTAFTVPAPHGLGPTDANGRADCPSGFQLRRDGLVSLETADPHGLFRLVTITNVWFGRGSGVASSGPGVRHRPLANHL